MLKQWSAVEALACFLWLLSGFAAAQTYVYVGNSHSHSVSVIDADKGTVIAEVPVGIFPSGIACGQQRIRYGFSD